MNQAKYNYSCEINVKIIIFFVNILKCKIISYFCIRFNLFDVIKRRNNSISCLLIRIVAFLIKIYEYYVLKHYFHILTAKQTLMIGCTSIFDVPCLICFYQVDVCFLFIGRKLPKKD